jgi:hypothetical protein
MVDMAESKKTNEIEESCGWIYAQLTSTGRVAKNDFFTWFRAQSFGKNTRNPDPNWHRASHAIYAILTKQEKPIEKEDQALVLHQPERLQHNALDRYMTDRFQTDEESGAKEHIGGLIAPFLLHKSLRKKTIFLGSGSTILNVGLKMCKENQHYPQRFVTVNIPLAALLCEPRQTRPVSKISIPEAVLDTDTSRFSTMPGLGWPLTVSIVAADGCFYDEDSKKVVLYGNEEAVATNTNLFVQNTRHTVLFCLTSNKIKVGFAANPNTGPPIRPPKKPVIRVLVTDQRYQRAVDALTADDWLIVTEPADWNKVIEHMEQGERPPE